MARAGLNRKTGFATLTLAIATEAPDLDVVWYFAGPVTALKIYVVPIFLVFPVVFALNRLGQHYDIRPEDPAQVHCRQAPTASAARRPGWRSPARACRPG